LFSGAGAKEKQREEQCVYTEANHARTLWRIGARDERKSMDGGPTVA
jgi:hypothetical protein